MCDVAVPLPKCEDCVATERAVLRDKLLLTPGHPLIEARLKQLAEDELLRDDALAALDAERAAVARSGGVTRELSQRQSELCVKRQERQMWAGRSRLLVASNDDFSTYPLDVVLPLGLLIRLWSCVIGWLRTRRCLCPCWRCWLGTTTVTCSAT